ncbi:unnamed protein product [Rotaria sordida]|uniref:Uncharacterized protein n=1 Tax=Rotaria sordida TaxID=392033 RepID=A0A814TB03_9BILA|nr:unnamed protein product [Rotaria sordida]CAF3928203.1 unnamed protein product [Rotaria sordida]
MFLKIQRQLKIFLLIICYCSDLIIGGPDQRRLLKYLLTDNQYNPIERPVQNDSNTLPVTMNLALQHIIDFDGKNEAIVISGWMTIMWNDYSLKWQPEEFGNIQTLRIPSTQIWTPDILLYNSADEKFDTTMKVNAVVQYNGDVLYVPPILFKSICSFNIAAFPFVRINLTAESSQGQLDAYVKSAEWDLEDFSATNNGTKYECCPTVYPYVLYTIRMRRRSLYYFTNIVLPCFLISCMTLLGFLLAPDSGEKLTLQITILLTIVMFSLLLSDIMPPSSNAIPIITVYFMCVMIMSTISVVASVLVISLHFRNSKNYSMPLWLRKYICNYLAWLLCMKRPGHDLSWRAIRRKWTTSIHEPNNINGSIDNRHSKIPSELLLNNTFELLSTNVINIDKEPLELLENDEKQHSTSLLEFSVPSVTKIQRSRHHHNLSKELYTCDMEMVRSELRIIISQLAILTNHFRQVDKHDDESQDWQFVAMVIDRLCLIIFAIVMILFTVLTFFNA